MGTWQKKLKKWLLDGDTIYATAAHHLSGSARNWSNKYQLSLDNLIKHMREQGYNVVYTPGPRGGMWKGTYHLDRSQAEEFTYPN